MKGSYLISNKEYIDSVRFLGLTTIDAINELVDNSFDADADKVIIHIFKEGKEISIAIEDDGNGIKPDKIDKVLSFGGRISNGKISTGRFGWGLSSSACCQAVRTEVYSKTQDNWFYSHIDLNELKDADEPIIPEAKIKEFPKNLPLKLKNSKSGTVVYLSNCDKLDYKSVNKLTSHIVQKVGEIHRKFLGAGKKIFVNDIEVKVVDPLMLMPGCMYSDLVGQASEFAEIKPIDFEDEIDPITGKPAQVKIKLALMDLEKIRGNKDWRKIPQKVGFNINNQGFFILRHNRQIGRAVSLSIYSKHGDYNYFRGEISFPPVLDKYFGVQTNKGRFSLDPSLRDIIEERVKKHLSQIRDVVKKWQRKAEAEESGDGVRSSEEIAAKVDKLLKKSKHEPTADEIKQAEEEINKKKEEEIKKVEENPQLTEDEKKEKKQKIENKFQFYRPFKRVLEFIESGNFYFPRPKGKSTEVVINTAHPFYKKVYERATQNNMDVFLDLILFTLAKAELEFYDNDDIKKYYRMQRAEWSAILSAFLDECFENEGDE